MSQTVVGVLLSTILIIAGCGGSRQLSPDSIRTAVYDMEGEGKITFTEGRYGAMGLIDLFAFGDMNGDGLEDGITFVSNNTGGSGVFISLEVLLNNDGTPLHVASYLVGDRIAIDSVAISGGVIDLQIITQGPGDPMCCPTLHVTRKLRLENGEVVEVDLQ